MKIFQKWIGKKKVVHGIIPKKLPKFNKFIYYYFILIKTYIQYLDVSDTCILTLYENGPYKYEAYIHVKVKIHTSKTICFFFPWKSFNSTFFNFWGVEFY